MLVRLRWLKTAITMLHATGEIDCILPTKEQWTILHQIEITLSPMARFQRILEAEAVVTGSLVPLALYQIRKAYVVVCGSDATADAVKTLTAILLKDLDERYVPENNNGQVAYTGNVVVGNCNRYTGLHPLLMCASMLDPRTKGLLSGDKEGVEYIMTKEHFELLKVDMIEHMIAYVLENKVAVENEEEDEGKHKFQYLV